LSSTPPQGSAAEPETHEALLKLLDREAAIARATDGRLAVLVIELRRVDRLQALLRGPAPATTMELVLERLHKALRPEDRLAALGDDQVCVVLPRLSHQSQAVLAAVKLLRALDRPIAHEGGAAVLRPCVGIASLPEHGFDPAELLMAADISRQIAATREEGYHVFQGEGSVESQVYRGLDLELERAIRANELELHYQPQVRLADGRAIGAEALVRWRHLKEGDIAASTIVAIAERTGLIGALTFWACNTAMRQLAQWRAADMVPRLALNISAASLNDRELPALLDQSIRTWGVAADQVALEISEAAMMALIEAERQQAVLTRLKGFGCHLVVDDFGSGYTSLAQLRRLPVDEIKIDRTFVAGMTTEPGDAALVRSAIDIGRHFGFHVVAEGVEREEVRDALVEAGCEAAQGYLFAAPMTAAALREWWTKHS
jgi:EAL domain-containing protein (putative c-di-GMP-specific phosphodiesterase class I)/GGDEF domain-containing protein